MMRQLPVYVACFVFGIKQAMRDRVETLGGLMIFALLITIFSTVFTIMPLHELRVPNLTPAHMLWSFAICECIIIGCPGLASFGREIKEGKLGEFMQRPTHLAPFVLSRFVGFHAFVTLLQLAFALAVLPLLFNAPLPMALAHWPLFLLSLFMGIVIMEMLGFALSTLEILGPYSQPVNWIVGKFVFAFGGLFFPVSCFPPWLEKLVLLTPFPSVISFPSQFMLTQDVGQLLLGLVQQAFWMVAVAGLVVLAHNRMTQRVLQQGD